MKFLLIASMLVASVFANANDQEVKCFEKRHGEVDLAYIIKSGHDDPAMTGNGWLKLYDCSHHDSLNCNFRGTLRRDERQEENCLVLNRDNMNRGWSLCHEEQLVDPRLVPVTVTDENQESRVYCEREILRLLKEDHRDEH